MLFREAIGASEEGIKINGEIINNLRYADDTVLIADSPEDLQTLIDRVVEACERYGMKLNCKKTKILIVTKNDDTQQQFRANNETLEIVDKITYLGCNLNKEWNHSQEIRCRTEKARAVFNRLRKILCNMHLSIDIRMRVLRCYVFSTLLYGVEAWTLTEATSKRLEAFEMWCYRRMLRISYIYHVTNNTVMQRMNKDLEIMRTVKTRKLSYLGHVMRNEKYHLIQLILQGKIEGKRTQGRRRTSWLKNIRQWTGMTTVHLFRTAVNKIIWTNVIANVHRG